MNPKSYSGSRSELAPPPVRAKRSRAMQQPAVLELKTGIDRPIRSREKAQMFRLTVSDHIMIAHSIRGAVFGPAQSLHGNTLVIEVEFQATALDNLNFLIDINLAKSELRQI